MRNWVTRGGLHFKGLLSSVFPPHIYFGRPRPRCSHCAVVMRILRPACLYVYSAKWTIRIKNDKQIHNSFANHVNANWPNHCQTRASLVWRSWAWVGYFTRTPRSQLIYTACQNYDFVIAKELNIKFTMQRKYHNINLLRCATVCYKHKIYTTVSGQTFLKTVTNSLAPFILF